MGGGEIHNPPSAAVRLHNLHSSLSYIHILLNRYFADPSPSVRDILDSTSAFSNGQHQCFFKCNKHVFEDGVEQGMQGYSVLPHRRFQISVQG